MNQSLSTATIERPFPPSAVAVVGAVFGVIALWVVVVTWAATSGRLATIPPPAIAALVAAGVVLPTACYFASRRLQALARGVGLVPLTLLHAWRVPAALVFFGYGLRGELPPLFWLLAGTGDLIAGLYALKALRTDATEAYFRRFHRFGFADFCVAVGTGLAFTLAADPRMAPIASWPLALIPLFGVGLSGAAHLIAFDLLRQRRAGGA